MQTRSIIALSLIAGFWGMNSVVASLAQKQPSSLKIVRLGKEQMVAAAEDKSCPNLHDPWIHVPDTPVSAFKRSDGSVVLLALNRRDVPLTGPNIDTVGPTECTPLIVSKHLSDPAKYNDNIWLTSVLRFSSHTYVAFLHEEYHGYEHNIAGCKVSSGEVQARHCWYGSTLLAISNDGGFTFKQLDENQVIASPQVAFTAAVDRIGFGNPKALISPQDQTPYIMVTSYGDIGQQQKGQCLLRGDLHDPLKWRAWDGTSFSVEMAGAYNHGKLSGTCKIVTPDNIWSIRFDKPLGVFIALGQIGRNVVCLYSRDLISWSAPAIVGDFVPLREWKPGEPAPTSYYSLLDPTSSSPNFDTIEGKPYLYFVRWHVENGKPVNGKRDIVRQEISISLNP